MINCSGAAGKGHARYIVIMQWDVVVGFYGALSGQFSEVTRQGLVTCSSGRLMLIR